MTQRDRLNDEKDEVSSEELLRLIGSRPVAVNVMVHGELEAHGEGALIVNVAKTEPASP